MYRTTIAVLTASLLAACGGSEAVRLSTVPGKLAPCEDRHCVSSQARDPKRRVLPLVYGVAPAAAQMTLVTVLQATDGAQLADNRPGYVHAVFEGSVLGTTDDVEFVFVPGSNRIDVRLATRGVEMLDHKRERLEKIRAEFDKTQP